MKKTRDLYRCKASLWADMPYRNALALRILKAEDAMKYYKGMTDRIPNKFGSDEYLNLVEKFKDSEEARDWNIRFLDEL